MIIVNSMLPEPPFRCKTCRLGLASGRDGCVFLDARRAAGTVLVREGERPETVYYVRRGQVAIGSTRSSGEEQPCAIRGPDTLIGIEGLLGEPARYQAWALTEVVLCHVDADSFRAWVGGLEGPAGAVLTLLMRETAQRVVEREALGGTTLQRVARFLLEHLEATGREPLDVQQRVLASMLGMRAETLSRALATLRRDGALAKGRSVRLGDIDRLRDACA